MSEKSGISTIELINQKCTLWQTVRIISMNRSLKFIIEYESIKLIEEFAII